MEQYPLIMDGAEIGSVSVHSDGGWTYFDAQCAEVQGIVRVSVYGGGREGYLGILAPENGRFALHRRLSRAALRDFPVQIEFAGTSGLPAAAVEIATEPEAALPEAAPGMTPEPEGDGKPEMLQESGTKEKTETAPEPQPETADRQNGTPPELEDVYWYASPDGALVCFDGEHNLIALPAGDARIPDGPGGWPKTIEGKNYVVYRTKDGRLIR